MESQQDIDHLRLLTIGFYVLAGLTALFSLIPLIHVAVGIGFILAPPPPGPRGDAPPWFFGWLFVGVGGTIIVLGELTALLYFLAGRSLQKRRRRTLIMVAAALACLNMPLGTALGVFTFLVLGRPSVKPSFS